MILGSAHTYTFTELFMYTNFMICFVLLKLVHKFTGCKCLEVHRDFLVQPHLTPHSNVTKGIMRRRVGKGLAQEPTVTDWTELHVSTAVASTLFCITFLYTDRFFAFRSQWNSLLNHSLAFVIGLVSRWETKTRKYPGHPSEWIRGRVGTNCTVLTSAENAKRWCLVQAWWEETSASLGPIMITTECPFFHLMLKNYRSYYPTWLCVSLWT